MKFINLFWIFILGLFGLVLTACTPSEQFSPTPFPTAIPPASFPEATWAISFEMAFPPGTWTAGPHKHKFHVHCSVADMGNYISDWAEFDVDEDVSVKSFPVYLRVGGISSSVLGFDGSGSIHPDQETIAVTTLFLSKDAAFQAYEECKALFQIDNTQPQLLTSGAPYRP